MAKQSGKIIKWFQFRSFLLIGVGILLWIGFQWWQKSFIAPTAVNDSQMAAEVLAEIGRRSPFDLLNIHADVAKGHVKLSGKIRSKEEEKEIVKIANGVKGVVSVAVNFELDPALRTPDEVKRDSFLAIKAKSAIAIEEGLRVFQIRVTAHKGIITLEGEVPFEEHHTLAERVILRVSGVRQVVNKIRVGQR